MKILNETERKILSFATELIADVQNGSSPNRNLIPKNMRGSIAQRLWDDSTFTYGMEYGVILASLLLKELLTNNKFTENINNE